jgi:hypothetical protein
MKPMTHECYDSSYPRKIIVETVLVIEYHDGNVHAVVTDHNAYDFYWCQRDGCHYYHDSGGGGASDGHFVGHYNEPNSCQIWTAPGVTFCDYAPGQSLECVAVSESELTARGYERIAAPLLEDGQCNPFEVATEQDGLMVYCSICDDWLPSDSLCRHIYQPGDGYPVGSGSDDPREDYMMAALDWLETVPADEWRDWKIWRYDAGNAADAVSALEVLLVSGKKFCQMRACSRGIEDVVRGEGGGEMDEIWNAVEDGLGWLTTLGSDTPDENAKTLVWIAKWRKTEKKRAKAKERKRLIAQVLKIDPASAPEVFAALGIPGKKCAELDGVSTKKLRAVLEQFRPAEVK